MGGHTRMGGWWWWLRGQAAIILLAMKSMPHRRRSGCSRSCLGSSFLVLLSAKCGNDLLPSGSLEVPLPAHRALSGTESQGWVAWPNWA